MAMSPADTKFVADMTACCKDCVATAKAYLATSPGDRNANLSEMARMSIKDDMAEMAQMASMMSAKPMPAKPGM